MNQELRERVDAIKSAMPPRWQDVPDLGLRELPKEVKARIGAVVADTPRPKTVFVTAKNARPARNENRKSRASGTRRRAFKVGEPAWNRSEVPTGRLYEMRASGMSNAQIGREVGLRPSTVGFRLNGRPKQERRK